MGVDRKRASPEGAKETSVIVGSSETLGDQRFGADEENRISYRGSFGLAARPFSGAYIFRPLEKCFYFLTALPGQLRTVIRKTHGVN